MRPRLEMGRAALAIKYQELREVAESCADKLQRLGEGPLGELAAGGTVGHMAGWLREALGSEGQDVGRPIPWA